MVWRMLLERLRDIIYYEVMKFGICWISHPVSPRRRSHALAVFLIKYRIKLAVVSEIS
jgi:hypothetical protein